MATTFLPLPLSLNLVQHTRWTAAQESGLQSYPFPSEHEGNIEEQVKQNVVRIYLQFLWLPESIMPLSLLVPSIASSAPSEPHLPTSPHILHRLLEPLIMTPRAASNKYYVDLSQILVDGGGAGEIEEQMMWFALSYEKGSDTGGAYQDANANDTKGEGEETEPWRNEKWRKGWLERMERREVQIQVLLHFLKLALPGPRPIDEVENTSEPARMPQKHYLPRNTNRRQSKKERQDKRPTLSTRETLEIYMDKMSTWQLLSGIEQRIDSLNNNDKSHGIWPTDSKDDERDWIQIFVNDIVEKQFRPYLPDLCDLFRQKVLPSAPLSDSGEFDLGDVQSAASTRSNSPVEVSSLSCSISTSSSLRRRSEADIGNSRLSRSRSLSISLQQERESQRDASNYQKTKKRTLNREVSMSFRAKSKGPTPGPENTLSFGMASGLGAGGQKPAGATNRGKLKTTAAKSDAEITLVEATPMKNRIKAMSTASMTSLGKETILRMVVGHDQGRCEPLAIDADTDIWESELPKTGDIIIGTGGEDEEVLLVAETPTKAKSRTKLTVARRGRS